MGRRYGVLLLASPVRVLWIGCAHAGSVGMRVWHACKASRRTPFQAPSLDAASHQLFLPSFGLTRSQNAMPSSCIFISPARQASQFLSKLCTHACMLCCVLSARDEDKVVLD